MINRILLIDVELDKIAVAGQLKKNWIHYPTGLLYLAAFTKKQIPDINIQVFHTAIHENSRYELSELLISFKPDLIGFRTLSRFKNEFLEFAILCKKICNAIIIAGGPYPSISYDEILKYDCVDLIVIGEGELTFVEIVKEINAINKIPINLRGTIAKVNGNIIVNSPREYISDINILPFPDYDMININDYSGFSNHAFKDTAKCGYILTSRGCPYNCFYCHQLFGRKLRRRSSDNVVEEMLQKYYKYHINEFVFLDDIFNVPLTEGKNLLKKISSNLPKDIRIDFPNGLRADCIDDEFIELLKECGLINIALAVESASPKIQRVIGKNLNIELALKNIDNISRKFITTVFYMIGFPNETMDDAKETLAFAKVLKYVAQPVLSILRVYQNTKIYNYLKPTPTQKEYIQKQETLDLQTKLNEPMSFYGDVFSDDIVPLNSKLINNLRLQWMKNVLLDSERIRYSNRIMKNYLSDDEISLFYKDMFDDTNFDVCTLNRKVD